jgi:excisionase family DNA binding protein
MASKNGAKRGESIDLPVINKKRSRVWFLNDDLVQIVHTNRSAGIVTLYNKTKDQRMTTTVVEFKKKRKKAYTVSETAKLLNCHRKHIPRLVKKGIIPEPVGELPGGKRAFHYLSYYSEDTIMEARRAMSMIHQGQPRKDGLITNNKTPTEQELRYAMGDGMILYTKDENGRFIPIFSETV